jgi:hypothetical protein
METWCHSRQIRTDSIEVQLGGPAYMKLMCAAQQVSELIGEFVEAELELLFSGSIDPWRLQTALGDLDRGRIKVLVRVMDVGCPPFHGC